MLALHVQLGILSITDFEPKVLVNLRHNVQTNLPRNMWKHVYVGLLDWARPWDLTWLGAGLAMHMFGRLHGIDLGGYHQSHLWVSTTVAAANVEEDDVHPTVDN